MEYDKSLEYINIFNRCIFKKSTKSDMLTILKYYTDIEDYEKCIVIKELIDCEYYVDDPVSDDLIVITKIINDNKKNLKDNNSDDDSDDDNNDIIIDIDNITDDILTDIMKDIEIREKYLIMTYNEIKQMELPTLKKERSTKLLIEYRLESVNNLKRLLNL